MEGVTIKYSSVEGWDGALDSPDRPAWRLAWKWDGVCWLTSLGLPRKRDAEAALAALREKGVSLKEFMDGPDCENAAYDGKPDAHEMIMLEAMQW